MTRLHTPPVAEASGHAAQLFSAIKSAVGKVPNAYATVGGNSPVALEAALNLDAALKKSSLSAREIEVIRLSVSEAVACDYCLAAHTLMAKKNGLSREAILGLRHGQPSGDARNDALANFVRSLVTTRGTVASEVLGAVKEAGFSDAQVVDATLAIAGITFTNLVNRVNDTTLDFPAAD
ncbi:MAG: carboxymuconolactone decarboxylase family protein [Collimonas sp.]|uniref:carboxymuconolactone decarboxylase family protein n=1 Tax=Collimonas sp. TaxID=1963772 RepID=UPI003264348D